MDEITPFSEWGIAKIYADQSSLPGDIVIFASNKGTVPFSPRIKVSRLKDGRIDSAWTFWVRISDAPAVVAEEGNSSDLPASLLAGVFAWVSQNKVPLLRYWNSDDYSTRKFLEDLKCLTINQEFDRGGGA